jgi:YidC/Oxa1 family membrane protein insertase
LGGFVPNIQAHLTILPRVSLIILMAVYIGSQVGSTLLMPSTADPKQKYIFAALPVLFAGFILSRPFPAGLLLYWITSNLWTVGQAAAIRHWFPPPALPALAPAPKKKPPPPRRPPKATKR